MKVPGFVDATVVSHPEEAKNPSVTGEIQVAFKPRPRIVQTAKCVSYLTAVIASVVTVVIVTVILRCHGYREAEDQQERSDKGGDYEFLPHVLILLFFRSLKKLFQRWDEEAWRNVRMAIERPGHHKQVLRLKQECNQSSRFGH